MANLPPWILTIPLVALTLLLAVSVRVALPVAPQEPLRSVGWLAEPKQEAFLAPLELPAPPGYQIAATDEYEVEALVLSAARYREDRYADVAPLDLLLGWGEVAQEPALSALTWTQGGRWAEFTGDVARLGGLDRDAVQRQSANTHIVPLPGDNQLDRALLSIRPGDKIRLKGFLVRILDKEGQEWVSSRRRDDNGLGACEILYVTDLTLP